MVDNLSVYANVNLEVKLMSVYSMGLFQAVSPDMAIIGAKEVAIIFGCGSILVNGNLDSRVVINLIIDYINKNMLIFYNQTDQSAD